MLRIPLALVGVAGHTILAQRLPSLADARAALVGDDAIADAHVADVRPELLDHPGDLVAEYLGLLAKRSRASGVVTVVVGRTCDDVQVGPTETNCGHANDDFVTARVRARHVSELDAVRVDEHSGAHQLSLHARPDGNVYVSRLSARMVML
jgi:hypothetical protein